jgi:transketolase
MKEEKGELMKSELIIELEGKANRLRKLTIESIGKLGVGHIGGCLSICDVLSVLYFKEMNIDPKEPKMADRDRFILSKGHGGPALYAALAEKGYFDKLELDTLNRSNTNLPSHCDMKKTTGIDMTAGSLGQGFSASIGFAIAGKMDQKDYYVYTLIGDGESQEGQIWEAAMLGGNRHLDNLIAFCDFNNLQIDGTTDEINSLRPMDMKWEAFGWHTQVIDGHDVEAILNAIQVAKATKGKPSMIIMNTIKGKGAYFAENQVGSHNMPVTEEQWTTACSMLDEAYEAMKIEREDN